jgi:hypothetical protein
VYRFMTRLFKAELMQERVTLRGAHELGAPAQARQNDALVLDSCKR